MKKCKNCGEPTSFNSYFSREVCPYCGWMDAAPQIAKTHTYCLSKKEKQRKILVPVG